MPKFQRGDKVTVRGQAYTIQSWPLDDDGPYVVTQQIPDGKGGHSDVFATFWTSAQPPDEDKGEVRADEEPELTSKGDGTETSTALTVPSAGEPEEEGYEDHANGTLESPFQAPEPVEETESEEESESSE